MVLAKAGFSRATKGSARPASTHRSATPTRAGRRSGGMRPSPAGHGAAAGAVHTCVAVRVPRHAYGAPPTNSSVRYRKSGAGARAFAAWQGKRDARAAGLTPALARSLAWRAAAPPRRSPLRPTIGLPKSALQWRARAIQGSTNAPCDGSRWLLPIAVPPPPIHPY